MAEKLNINEWAEEERPRERLLAQGARALTNAELLAILIGSGNTDESAVELMRRILVDAGGSLKQLGRLSYTELCRYKGIGAAKAVTLMAACEIGKRRAEEPPVSRPVMNSAEAIYRHFRPLMQDLAYEECYVLLLNQQLQLLDTQMVGMGGLSDVSVDLRRVLHLALMGNAAAIALCHNHPSGSCHPSEADNVLTERLHLACQHIGIRLIDHLIFTDTAYYSYADEGRW